MFNKAPIDLNPLQVDSTPDSLLSLFVSQRRPLLKVIMEDVLTASEKRLSRVKCISDIEESKDYHITFSHDIQECMNEVWEKLQSGILHKDSRVQAANFRASQIVNALFYLYAFSPDLIDCKYKANHELLIDSDYMRFYCDNKNEKIGIAKQKVAPYNFNLVIGKKIEIEGDNYKLPIYNLILSKDYVSSLTDQQALKEYHTHFGFTENLK